VLLILARLGALVLNFNPAARYFSLKRSQNAEWRKT
jgi:hypothetical protein